MTDESVGGTARKENLVLLYYLLLLEPNHKLVVVTNYVTAAPRGPSQCRASVREPTLCTEGISASRGLVKKKRDQKFNKCEYGMMWANCIFTLFNKLGEKKKGWTSL